MLFFSVCFICCNTLETYVENAENNYTAIAIEEKSNLFIEKLKMGNYSLVNTSNEHSKITFLLDEEKDTRNYNFYNGNSLLYKIEIVKSEHRKQITNNFSLEFGTNRYISINKTKYNVNLDTDNNNQTSPYLEIQDSNIGKITFYKYYSRNKKSIEKDSNYNTGLSVFVNNNEYGIVSFYPTAFYLKNEYISNFQINQEKITLYLMSAYMSDRYLTR